MHDSTRSEVILLSIHPQYAQAILEGKKRVEFRKQNIPRHISHVVLYATRPVGRVVGYFSVAKIVEGKPSHLWSRFNGSGGISEEGFAAYYGDAVSSVGLVVKKAHPMRKQVRLEELAPSASAPNSFRYLREDEFRTVLRHARRV